MKLFFYITALISFSAFCCEESPNNSLKENQLFDQAANKADYVIVGEIMRTFSLPNWEKGEQGVIIKTIADLKGYISDYVDGAYLPTEGISPSKKQNPNYWPIKIDSLHLFSIKKENDNFFITAVANANDEHLFRSCLRIQRERALKEMQKQDEEDFKLPPHLRIDHTADFDK